MVCRVVSVFKLEEEEERELEGGVVEVLASADANFLLL